MLRCLVPAVPPGLLRPRPFLPLLRPIQRHTSNRCDRLPTAAATAVISGGLLVAMLAGWEREAGEVRCEPAAIKGVHMMGMVSGTCRCRHPCHVLVRRVDASMLPQYNMAWFRSSRFHERSEV